METLIFGTQVSLLGVVIVFVALAFLIVLIRVMTKVTNISLAKKDTSEPVVAKEDSTLLLQEEILNIQDDSEIIAVIAAAIAYLSQGKMKIKAIKRVKGEHTPTWSYAGRQETMYLRQTR